MSFEHNQWETQERERTQGTNTECPSDSARVMQAVKSITIESKLFPWAFCLHIVAWCSNNLNLEEAQTDSLFNETPVYSDLSYFTLGIVTTLGLLRVLKATKLQAVRMAVCALAGPLVLVRIPFDNANITGSGEVVLLEAAILGVIAGDVLLGLYRWARGKLGISPSV